MKEGNKVKNSIKSTHFELHYMHHRRGIQNPVKHPTSKTEISVEIGEGFQSLTVLKGSLSEV